MEYWLHIISGAWKSTIRPLQWTKERAVSTAVLIIGTVVVGGFAAVSQLASTHVALITGTIFVAICLFVIGAIQTQHKLYFDLAAATDDKIAALQKQLSQVLSKKPNYEIWRTLHKYTLMEAAYLWCDCDPNVSAGTKDTAAQVRSLESAIQTGKLEFIHHSKYASDVEHEQKYPHLHTEIRRLALQEYAKREDQDPAFLRDI
jgi:hypothetical protein